jgi:hypothetical protein
VELKHQPDKKSRADIDFEQNPCFQLDKTSQQHTVQSPPLGQQWHNIVQQGKWMKVPPDSDLRKASPNDRELPNQLQLDNTWSPRKGKSQTSLWLHKMI